MMEAKRIQVDANGREDTPFSAYLKARLAALGWTQAEFSRRSGIPEATISSWKRSPRGLSVGHIQRIAATLHISEGVVLDALSEGPTSERGTRWERFAAWMAEAPELNVAADDFTIEEFSILVGFAARLLDAAKDGAVKAFERLGEN